MKPKTIAQDAYDATMQESEWVRAEIRKAWADDDVSDDAALIELITYGLLEGPPNAVSDLYADYGFYPMQNRDYTVEQISAFHEGIERAIFEHILDEVIALTQA